MGVRGRLTVRVRARVRLRLRLRLRLRARVRVRVRAPIDAGSVSAAYEESRQQQGATEHT